MLALAAIRRSDPQIPCSRIDAACTMSPMGEKVIEEQNGRSDRDGFVDPIEVFEARGFLRLALGRSRTF